MLAEKGLSPRVGLRHDGERGDVHDECAFRELATGSFNIRVEVLLTQPRLEDIVAADVKGNDVGAERLSRDPQPAQLRQLSAEHGLNRAAGEGQVHQRDLASAHHLERHA